MLRLNLDGTEEVKLNEIKIEEAELKKIEEAAKKQAESVKDIQLHVNLRLTELQNKEISLTQIFKAAQESYIADSGETTADAIKGLFRSIATLYMGDILRMFNSEDRLKINPVTMENEPLKTLNFFLNRKEGKEGLRSLKAHVVRELLGLKLDTDSQLSEAIREVKVGLQTAITKRPSIAASRQVDQQGAEMASVRNYKGFGRPGGK